MLEEYVGSSFKDQRGIVSHKSTDNNAQSVVGAKVSPLEQNRAWIPVVDLNVSFNFSDKNCLNNNNNLVFINLKFFEDPPLFLVD